VPAFCEFWRLIFRVHKTAILRIFVTQMNPFLTFTCIYACALCRHNIICQRSPKLYFIGLCRRFCELSPSSPLCWLWMGSQNCQRSKFPQVRVKNTSEIFVAPLGSPSRTVLSIPRAPIQCSRVWRGPQLTMDWKSYEPRVARWHAELSAKRSAIWVG
jgi:hypothetical protein